VRTSEKVPATRCRQRAKTHAGENKARFRQRWHLSSLDAPYLQLAVKFWFWFLWSVDAVIAAVTLYFFFSLSAGGRVGSFNILPWLAILAVLATVVGGSVWLRSAGQHALAIILLLLLAVPGALYALFLLLILILQPDFR
jgi:hypothetical protein